MNHTDIGDFDNNGQFVVVDVAVSVCQQLLLDVVGNDLCMLFRRDNAGRSLCDPTLVDVQKDV